MASDKIFVDLDEEIVFTVEKVLESSADKVIVVIPESANLVASLISLKLLSRQIAKSAKTIVIVTEDNLGLKLAKEAGLVAKRKISEITPRVWAEAKELKDKFLKQRNKLKKELIEDRTEQGQDEITEDQEYIILDKNEDEDKSEDIIEKSKEEELESKLKNIGFKPVVSEKPRLEPKVVKLGKIAVLSGGDIEKEKDLAKELYEATEISQKTEKVAQKRQVNAIDETEKNIQKPRSTTEQKQPSIVGRDISSMFVNRPVRNLPTKSRAKTDSVKNFIDKIKIFYNSGNKNLKLIITGVIFVVGFYLISTVFSSARVDIYLDKIDVSINEVVTADVSASSVNGENLTIPMKQVKIPMQSSSNNADTTGTVESGEKARGLVTFYNKTEQAIHLDQSTTLENINSGLKYKLLEAVDIPAAVIDGGGNVNVGVLKDISIEAESFGEKYNVSGSASYKIASYTTDQLSAKSFTSISGGTTNSERAVAQSDIDELKDGLIAELKNSLTRSLDQLISEDEIILDNTLQFNEPTVSSDKQVNEKADIVNVTVSMDATAYVISKEDLKELVAYLIKNDSKINVEVEKDEIKDPAISNVSLEDQKATFTVSSSGNVIAGFDKEEIKKNIKGKSIGEAKAYLAGLQGVDRYKLNVSPFFVPSFLKKVPDENKISVFIHQ